MPPFNWNDLRFFLAMARTGSPMTAALQLKVDHTTVRRRITALEEALGALLFEPRDRGFILTAAGDSLLETAVSIETLALGGEASLKGKDMTLSGTVRVGAPDGLASFFLVPHLARFATRHPDLQIEVDASARFFNLAKREADIALSVSPPEKGRQVIRKLIDCRMYLYASQAYLEQFGEPRTIADLKDHRMIGYFDEMEFAHGLNLPSSLTSCRFLSTSFVALYEAAAADGGLCLLPAYMIRDNGAGLRRVLEDEIVIDRQIWMAIHEDFKGIARFRAVADFISQTFNDHRELFMA